MLTHDILQRTETETETGTDFSELLISVNVGEESSSEKGIHMIWIG